MNALIIGTQSPTTVALQDRLARLRWKSLVANDPSSASRVALQSQSSFSLIVVDPSHLNTDTIDLVTRLRAIDRHLTVFVIDEDATLPARLRDLLPEGTYILRETQSDYFSRMLECVGLSCATLLNDQGDCETA